jgi:AICAR transformylase/IMP cyclohydrolase PurH
MLRFEKLLTDQKGETSIEQRKAYAAKAFEVVMHYDIAISNYFNPGMQQVLRYGENPHQQAVFHGNLEELFTQLNGKELSYNNLVDVDAAVQLINEFRSAKKKVYLLSSNIPMYAASLHAQPLNKAGMQHWPAILKALSAVYWFATTRSTKQPPKPSTRFSLKY